MISRAQRYKKAVKTEQQEKKISVFLMINMKYMMTDIQSIALLVTIRSAPMTEKTPAHARSRSESTEKNVRDAFSMVL